MANSHRNGSAQLFALLLTNIVSCRLPQVILGNSSFKTLKHPIEHNKANISFSISQITSYIDIYIYAMFAVLSRNDLRSNGHRFCIFTNSSAVFASGQLAPAEFTYILTGS